MTKEDKAILDELFKEDNGNSKQYTEEELEIIQQLKALGLGEDYLEIWQLFSNGR